MILPLLSFNINPFGRRKTKKKLQKKEGMKLQLEHKPPAFFDFCALNEKKSPVEMAESAAQREHSSASPQLHFPSLMFDLTKANALCYSFFPCLPRLNF